MQANKELMKQFEGLFRKIDAGEDVSTRPEMQGWTREVRHMHQVEEAVVRLHRHMAKNLAIPMPKSPETAYERWVRDREDTQETLLLRDIYLANPKALNFSVN